ncbi:MAG: sigma-54-dependent Fis family transcriptional regulator [Planctomycetes bacterium]|nr:sigma-54-dependent Fis family transcriptional regulator [Planctomycetota bacterium]
MSIETILVAEEDAQGREFLHQTLSRSGYEVESHGEGDAALAAFLKRDFDLILVSETLPAVRGLKFLERVKDVDATMPVVILTDQGSGAGVSEALRAGAEDFFLRPFDRARLQLLLEKILHRRRLQQEIEHLRETLRTEAGADELIGESEALRRTVRTARQLADDRAPILLRGEAGTGKRALARMIHFEGKRAAGPFVRVRCAGLPERLLESEILGHERGAFAGAHRKREGRIELAHGGTLVLEDVDQIPVNLQDRICRVLETGQFRRAGGRRAIAADVRVLALTTRDLAREAESGAFRRDLHRHLAQCCLELPPLRDRAADVPLLAAHFVNRYRQQLTSRVRGVSPEAMELLSRHVWRGNVHELRSLIERLVAQDPGEEIAPEHLPAEIGGAPAGRSDLFGSLVGLSVHEVEREMILKTLEETGNNKTAAARILGLTARTLHNKLRLYREQGVIARDAYRPLRKRREPRRPPLKVPALAVPQRLGRMSKL